MTPKPITIQGTTFPSMTAAAKHFGLTYKTFTQRLSRGLSFEEALTTPIYRNGRRKSHCKHGHLYDEQNTIYRTHRQYIIRSCRTCKRLKDRKSK